MRSEYSRRSVVAAGAGTVGALLTGRYAWTKYETRHYLRFRPLEAVNESDDAVTLALTVEGMDRVIRERVALAPSGDEDGDDRVGLSSYWIKYGDEWTVRAERDSRRIELTAAEITDRLEDSGWGTDCAHVSIVVTGDGALEGRVAPCANR